MTSTLYDSFSSNSRRTFMAAALAVLAIPLILGSAMPASAADQVSIQLDFTYIRGNYAPFYVGRDKGFFEEEGIEITDIHLGRGSADTAQRVAQGTSPFGFADLPTTLVVRSKGAPVVALAATNVVSPLAMVALEEHGGLKTPKDLEGRSIAVTPALSTYYFFRAFAAANGVDLSKVKEVSATPPYEPLLLSGRVTALPGYIDAEIPILIAHAGGADKVDVLLGEEHGYKTFGTGVISNDKVVAENPDLVERFMRAYIKSFQFVIDNPDEAVKLLVAVDSKLNADILHAQLKADIDHTFTNATTEKCGLGYMDPARWESTREVLVTQKVIESSPPINEVYTNKFVSSSCE